MVGGEWCGCFVYCSMRDGDGDGDEDVGGWMAGGLRHVRVLTYRTYSRQRCESEWMMDDG